MFYLLNLKVEKQIKSNHTHYTFEKKLFFNSFFIRKNDSDAILIFLNSIKNNIITILKMKLLYVFLSRINMTLYKNN